MSNLRIAVQSGGGQPVAHLIVAQKGDLHADSDAIRTVIPIESERRSDVFEHPMRRLL